MSHILLFHGPDVESIIVPTRGQRQIVESQIHGGRQIPHCMSINFRVGIFYYVVQIRYITLKLCFWERKISLIVCSHNFFLIYSSATVQ